MAGQKILWEKDSDFPTIRKPGERAKAESDASDAAVSSADIVQQSKLSADAKEFVPASFNSVCSSSAAPAAAPSVQNRLNRYKPLENNHHASTNSYQFHVLHNSIELLTVKPGKFDIVISTLLEHLDPYFTNVEAMFKITEIIFTQALSEQNFTYSGARLCAALDAQCSLLRGCLHQLCERELKREHPSTNLSVLTLFIAEIYTQMNYELFGKCLINALHKMLATPTPDNVKYICQTLKLSGAKLDKLDGGVIDKILEALRGACPQLPGSLAGLVQSVAALRGKQWGLAEPAPPAPLCEPHPDHDWSDEPVYYGPDGQQLTLEESDFLTENLTDLILDEEDPDGLYDPEPEMNEEIQAAFAEFVRMSHR